MTIQEKIEQTREAIKSAFYHEPYYTELMLAALASRSNILLEGSRGTGKTWLSKVLLRAIDEQLTASQQGYLSADFEQVIASPDIARLMKGEEQVKFRRIVEAPIKFFDEIQRLGPSAVSALFRLLTDGSVEYLDQTRTVERFMTVATANPTEHETDTLNIQIPEPLYDRFTATIWIPLAPLSYQAQINGNVQKSFDAIKPIWSEKDLLELWEATENIQVPTELELSLIHISEPTRPY